MNFFLRIFQTFVVIFCKIFICVGELNYVKGCMKVRLEDSHCGKVPVFRIILVRVFSGIQTEYGEILRSLHILAEFGRIRTLFTQWVVTILKADVAADISCVMITLQNSNRRNFCILQRCRKLYIYIGIENFPIKSNLRGMRGWGGGRRGVFFGFP